MIFLSHSHKDQRLAYGISSWLRVLWPAIRVFITSEDLTETHQMSPHYYLHMIPRCEVMLCLLSERFFASNELFDELEIADQVHVKVILVLAPDIKASDQFINFEGTIHRWEERFGGLAVDLAEPDAEITLSTRICSTLSLAQPKNFSPGALADQIEMVERLILPTSRPLPLPDVKKIPSGKITRDDAIKSLRIFMKHMDNQARAVGIDPELLPIFEQVPELQLILGLLATPIEGWPGIKMQCSPLFNDTFQHWIAHLLESSNGGDREKLLKMLMMCTW